MASKKNKIIEAATLKPAASEMLKESLDYLQGLQSSTEGLKFFPGGISLIEIGVAVGAVSVTFKVEGHDPK